MTELNPAVEEVVIELAKQGAPELNSLSVSGAREQFDSFLDEYLPNGTTPPERSLSIAGLDGPISLSVFRAERDRPAPVLLWFHGGGWTLGSTSAFAPFFRVLSEYTNYTVIGVQYRLAPEHPFPDGLIDCYTALEWVSNNPRPVFATDQPLAIGGDSAGANLAIATSLMANRRDAVEIDHQVLAYPATQFPPSPPTDSKPEYFLTSKDVDWFWNQYLEREIDGYHQYAAPLRARTFADFPPTTLITCEFDPLRKEGASLADRLAADDVPCYHHHFSSMPHGFLTLLGEPNVPTAHRALEQIEADLPSA